MKLPKMDEIVNCVKHPESLFAAGEGFVFFRQDGEETVLVHICSLCGIEAQKVGIPAQSAKILIESEGERQQYNDETAYAIELFDFNQKEKTELFTTALFACEAPLCDSPPASTANMAALILKEGEIERAIPICKAKCSDKARAKGLKVSDLHAIIDRHGREAKATLLYSQEQERQKIVTEFFTKFVKADPRGSRTEIIHQTAGPSGGGNVRMTPRGSGRL